jgi:probable rRNA maturation factor
VISVYVVSRVRGGKISIRRIERTARRILKLLDRDHTELSLALVRNREIQELNAKYRRKSEPTDVLSFPSQEVLPTGVQILGDVVISVEQAEKQAARRRRALEEEIESLLIHGILHLLGYDHERSSKEARVMRGMERKVSRMLCEERALRV